MLMFNRGGSYQNKLLGAWELTQGIKECVLQIHFNYMCIP